MGELFRIFRAKDPRLAHTKGKKKGITAKWQRAKRDKKEERAECKVRNLKKKSGREISASLGRGDV